MESKLNMTSNELIRSVAQWGIDKGLTDSNAQYVVMCEEVSELTTATSPEEILDGIGDVIVTAIVLHNQRSPDLDLTVREIREGIEKALTYKHLFVSRESLKSVVLHNARVIRKGTDEDVRKVMVAVVQETVFIAMKYDIDPMVALESVWNVIKDRTGKMVNNSFVKTEDLQ